MPANESTDFSTGRLFPYIVRFSFPAGASLLIGAIYNIVDRMFVGNYVGTVELAALSVCFPLIFLMLAFGLLCSGGGSTKFSLFRGKNDRESMDKAFGHAFVMVVVLELLLAAALLIFADPFLRLFGVTAETYAPALEYYRIVALGCVFQGLSLVFCDFTRVSGKPFLGMCVTGVGAIVNIALDALFIISFEWGVAGAAWATVIGQICSAAFGAYLLWGGGTLVRIRRAIFRPNASLGIDIARCGFALWVAQIAMGFIGLVYNHQLGAYGGVAAIGVYSVISSIMTFVMMPASGISQGIQPILGYNYSIGNGARVIGAMNQACLLSVGVTTVIWAVVMLFPRTIIGLFGGDAEMLAMGVDALRINFCVTPILGFVALATTFFQSLGKPNPSIAISVIRQIAALVPFIYILAQAAGLRGIFIAQPASDLLALVLCLIMLKREYTLLGSLQPAFATASRRMLANNRQSGVF